MKTQFSPDEFLGVLDGLGGILQAVVKSNNYQELTNCGKYAPDFNLIDAVQALEQASDTYAYLHSQDLAED